MLATSAAFSKGIFASETNNTNQINKAGNICYYSFYLSLDDYTGDTISIWEH
jgi:hypothetical protein